MTRWTGKGGNNYGHHHHGEVSLVMGCRNPTDKALAHKLNKKLCVATAKVTELHNFISQEVIVELLF